MHQSEANIISVSSGGKNIVLFFISMLEPQSLFSSPQQADRCTAQTYFNL